jgi:hypothetical protein
MPVSAADNFQIDQRLDSQLRYTEQVVASHDGAAACGLTASRTM